MLTRSDPVGDALYRLKEELERQLREVNWARTHGLDPHRLAGLTVALRGAAVVADEVCKQARTHPAGAPGHAWSEASTLTGCCAACRCPLDPFTRGARVFCSQGCSELAAIVRYVRRGESQGRRGRPSIHEALATRMEIIHKYDVEPGVPLKATFDEVVRRVNANPPEQACDDPDRWDAVRTALTIENKRWRAAARIR
jgi:hypothetical protein